MCYGHGKGWKGMNKAVSAGGLRNATSGTDATSNPFYGSAEAGNVPFWYISVGKEGCSNANDGKLPTAHEDHFLSCASGGSMVTMSSARHNFPRPRRTGTGT